MTFDFSAVTFPVADHLNRGDCTDMRLEGNLIIISTRYSYSDLKVYIHIHCMVSLKRRLQAADCGLGLKCRLRVN